MPGRFVHAHRFLNFYIVLLLYFACFEPLNKKSVFICQYLILDGYRINDDYSVIGAIRRKLLLEVGDLADDMKEDLRNPFHCWISKDLPDRLPYRYSYSNNTTCNIFFYFRL